MGTLTVLVSLTLLLLSCFSGYCSADRKAGSESTRQEQSWIGLTKQVYILGVWKPYLKTVNSCLNFRLNTTPPLFIVWPEDDGEFCCEDRLTPHTIASYVHSENNGRFLNPIPYYDVGIINDKTPYWTSWVPDRISQKDITNLVYCEVNDMKHFYVRRFWIVAFAKQGLLYSAIPFILLVELLVLLSAFPQWILFMLKELLTLRLSILLHLGECTARATSFQEYPPKHRPQLFPKTSPPFPRFLGRETTWDLVHLCFLGVNGSLLMEAVGHSDPCGWEAVLLYNSAVFYTYLTLLSIVSAVLQQVALWSRAITNMKITDDQKMERCEIEKEWQLQRVSAQAAVLLLAALYCTFVTVYSRNEFVAWLLGIIIIAQVWSCSVGVIMLSMAVKLSRECVHLSRECDERRDDLLQQVNEQSSEPERSGRPVTSKLTEQPEQCSSSRTET